MFEKINHNSVPKEIIDTLITLYKQGKFTQIIGRDPELTRIYPSSYNLLNIFGSANLSLERYQEAIKYFINYTDTNTKIDIKCYDYFCRNRLATEKQGRAHTQLTKVLVLEFQG